MDSGVTSRAGQAAETRGGLTSRSFLALLAVQFLGALNDNMFRWLAIKIVTPILGQAETTSLGLACFTLPYLLWATVAGFLADRFDKRAVIVGCKLAEIVLMMLAVAAIIQGTVPGLFVVVFLMGSQSALFGPSKFGSIPEMLDNKHLSSGNGLMGLVTVVASALGTFAGFWLYSLTEPDLKNPPSLPDVWLPAAALIGVAIAGSLLSRLIGRLPVADAGRKLSKNPLTETWYNLKLLGQNIPLLRASLGIAFFWFLASLANVNINVFGDNILGLKDIEIGALMVVLVIGVGLGSVLAGIWSGGKVELGIVPLGAAGIAISSMLLYVAGNSVDPSIATSAQQAYWWTCLWLFTLGLGAGLFNIPLEAYLQHHSEVKTRGIILAASNFIAFSFILLSAGLFYVMQKIWGMSASEIFLVAGLGTIPVVVYIVRLLPHATIRFIVWLASHTFYRVRVFGRENLPEKGGALLVANHVSWLDGILLIITSSRPLRMIAYADYVNSGPIGWLARLFQVIPIKVSEGPKALVQSLRSAREAILNGELVCIFAEGEITLTGQLQPFQRGMMRVIQGTSAPIIPVYLDELWGSIFSFRGGKFFWKRPRHWPYPVSISFGTPLTDPDNVNQVQQAVQNLGIESMQNRKSRQMVLPRQFLRQCRTCLFRLKVADSSGAELTGGRLLTGTLAFKRLLEREIISDEEEMVGLLLPPSAGAVIANTSLALMRKVAVNLNYTLSADVVNDCIKQCGIKHVLTSRRFLEKRPFDLNAELVFLEDLKEQVTPIDKALALAQAYLLPASVLERILGLTKIDPDDLLTVLFTSGSTGEPKGVMLSHHNVLSNTDGVDQLFHFDANDVLLGVLPFFHSFGYTGTLWIPLTLDPKGVYHFNPLDARQIGKLCEKYGVTITIATPTFLRSYLKRCTKEQMSKLDLVIVGAEKLPLELANAFEEKFGVQPTEGYGTTELSPVAAANVPDCRSESTSQTGTKLGTVGRPFPGVMAKIVDPDTREELGTNTPGLLLIKGPNVMLGYLNQPEKTAEVIRDGWYDTGDIATIDDDGFIEITGRQSRFSKIGGEMVPHIKIEEMMIRIVENAENEADDDDQADVLLAVTAIPDKKKGERLIIVHKPLDKTVNSILKELSDSGLPNLWIPSPDSFLEVEQVPLLGTGKLDLKKLKQLAMENF
jgi:acyl-[acyl-carrier-protein]-phospholipid O-acyltransferase/long-chain-fatty-acid--[acyl-carrier-protein] ligase